MSYVPRPCFPSDYVALRYVVSYYCYVVVSERNYTMRLYLHESRRSERKPMVFSLDVDLNSLVMNEEGMNERPDV